jgi:hypothetical protein
MKLKIITLMTLVIFSLSSVMPMKSYSGTGIFFSYSSAQKLAIDIKYLKDTNQYLDKENSLLVSQNTELKGITKISEQQIDLLNKNLLIVGTQKDEFKSNLLDCYKEVENKPSRLTWFSMGAFTTVIVAVLGFFFLRK